MLRTITKCTVAAGVAAAALVAAATVGATGQYVDKSGDASGAPDITNVSVASDATGQILFTIGVSGISATDGPYVLLSLDTDMNGATGAPNMAGGEYMFGVDHDSYEFMAWNGSAWAETPYSTVRVSGDSATVTISVNRSELGNIQGFNFWAATGQSPESDQRGDMAPDAGLWNYSLQANGPEIQAVMLQPTPLVPRAGKMFTVKPTGLRLPEAAEAPSLVPVPESYSCTAKLAGKWIVGRGVGRCTWQLPKTARGKKLAVVVTVDYQGATASFPFTFPVAK
jgi:hypothetical protein